MSDLTYTQDGMFTRFYPETKAGETAWRQAADQLGGVFAVLNPQAQGTIEQLRQAGYKVSKAKKVTGSIDDILQELGV